MKTILLLLGMAWSGSENATTAAEHAEPLILENTVLRMEIGRAPAPFVARLDHKASGQAVIAGPAFRSLFSITCRERGRQVGDDRQRCGGRVERERDQDRRGEQAGHQVQKIPGPRSGGRGHGGVRRARSVDAVVDPGHEQPAAAYEDGAVPAIAGRAGDRRWPGRLPGPAGAGRAR